MEKATEQLHSWIKAVLMKKLVSEQFAGANSGGTNREEGSGDLTTGL